MVRLLADAPVYVPQVLYLVGVNHVATGLAAYVNVAPSDPIQRLGLASWDDQEVSM
jgi:hypothetical protein